MNKEENVMAKGWKRFFSPDMLLLVDLCLIVLLVFLKLPLTVSFTECEPCVTCSSDTSALPKSFCQLKDISSYIWFFNIVYSKNSLLYPSFRSEGEAFGARSLQRLYRTKDMQSSFFRFIFINFRRIFILFSNSRYARGITFKSCKIRI